MDAALTTAVGAVAVGLLAALVVAARSGRRTPSAVAVPVALATLAITVAAGTWPPTGWMLVAALLAAPAPLARLARRGRAWSALATFALGGVVASYGTLGRLLCAAGSDPCDTPGADAAIVGGGAVAGAAALWLYVVGALGR